MTPLLTPEQFSDGTGGKIPASDPRVAPLLNGASAAIRRYCGWHITPVVPDTLRLDGPGGDLLVLPTLHLSEVASLAEHGATLTEDLDFEWSENGELRRLRGCWSARFRAIEAVVMHGFEDAPDVAQIIQQVVANALASPLGATREQVGPMSVTWASTAPGVAGGLSLLERDMAVLDLYRLPGGA